MIAQSVAEIVSHHVRLMVEGIDRMYLNVFVPGLQYEQGIVRFFREHRGQPLPSDALMSPMTRRFRGAIGRLCIRAPNSGGAVLQGTAQGRGDGRAFAALYGRGRDRVRRQGSGEHPGVPDRTAPQPENGTALSVDRAPQRDGQQLLRLCRRSGFWTVLSQVLQLLSVQCQTLPHGHEYAKRQLAQKGIAFEALDNGILNCADPKRLQKICEGLSAAKIAALLRKWLRLLPHPFTRADRKAGYRYDISILQAEFSTTQVLDRPLHGRLFFEQVIRENLDLGRPEQIELIFNRRIPRTTKARFRTRVVTQEVTPSLNVYYKNARIKQYHKENRALRTETTINNTYDFGIGKRLHNLAKLRTIGFAANQRLIEVERLSHDCILSEDTLQAINRPVTAGHQRASGLRFADPGVQALLQALILFRQLPQDFRAADLRQHLAAFSGRDPVAITQ